MHVPCLTPPRKPYSCPAAKVSSGLTGDTPRSSIQPPSPLSGYSLQSPPTDSPREFTLDDKLFPRSPGDSLLYNDKEITELQRWGYQVSWHWANRNDSTPQHPDKIDPAPSDGDSSKTMGSPKRKCAQCPPTTLT